MKTLLLAAVLLTAASCGKNQTKKNEWQFNTPYEVNPITGQVEKVRAVVPLTRIYVNERDRVIHVLETKSKYEQYQGVTCFGELESGMSRYDLSSDRRQLILYTHQGQEVYQRESSSESIIGSTWTKAEYRSRRGAQVISKLTFHDQDTAQLIVECPAR